MKPIDVAKKLWEKCVEIQDSLGTNISYGPAPLYSYPGILTMFAAVQAAVCKEDEEWINDVNSYLEKYPFKFEFKSGILTIEGKEIQKIKTKRNTS